MNTLDDHVVVASAKTPHRRFSAVAAFFDVPNQPSCGDYCAMRRRHSPVSAASP